MKLPTMKVKRKDGHVCIINESDFDASIHEVVLAKKAKEPEPAEVKPALAPAPEPEPEPEKPKPKPKKGKR